MYRLSGRDKPVSLRKTLQHCALPQRDSAILNWVSEAAISESKILCRDGRSGLIPSHSSVYAGISLACLTSMATRNEFLIPITPGAPWFGSSDASHVEFGK